MVIGNGWFGNVGVDVSAPVSITPTNDRGDCSTTRFLQVLTFVGNKLPASKISKISGWYLHFHACLGIQRQL